LKEIHRFGRELNDAALVISQQTKPRAQLAARGFVEDLDDGVGCSINEVELQTVSALIA
jgi:hypothetical protein